MNKNYDVYHFARKTLFRVKGGVFQGGLRLEGCPFLLWDKVNCKPIDMSDMAWIEHVYSFLN